MSMKTLMKHRQISQWIIDGIQSGQFRPGDRLPSEFALAEQFDASRQTVRHATDELVKKGILTRQRGSGTYVSKNSDVTHKESRRVGVITTYIDDYVFPGIIRGIESTLTPLGYTLSLGVTHDSHLEEADCLRRIIDDGICGLIIEGTKSAIPSPNLSFFEQLRAHNIPMIFLNGYYRELTQCGVFQDDVVTARMLTEQLIKNGHKKIAAVFKSDDLQGLKRFEGMQQALYAADLFVEDRRILWYTTEDVADYFSGSLDSFILNRFGDATALVCYNDQIAAQICDLLKRNGKSIPKDISVVSFDNSPLASDTAYCLTSSIYPSTEIGATAANLLVRCLRDNNYREHIRLQPEIAYRPSIRKLSGGKDVK